MLNRNQAILPGKKSSKRVSEPGSVSLQRSLSKGLSPKVSLNLISMSFYANSHLQKSKPLRFSLLQALERDPISLGNSLPIYSPPHFPCKLKLFIFQLASPPSIHMDSWWAACNLIQGPKWTHNTAYGRALAYGLDPYTIWAPKSQKKKQRSTQVSPTNRLNQLPTSPSG